VRETSSWVARASARRRVPGAISPVTIISRSRVSTVWVAGSVFWGSAKASAPSVIFAPAIACSENLPVAPR